MAIYEYRCARHGVIELIRPIGTAPESVACTSCDAEARRVFSPPMLRRADREVVAAMDRAEKTRDEPEVVKSIPSQGARRPTRKATMTPARKRLPRP